jgi:hypothetical protein
MKQLYPADEEYQQKVAEYLKFSESVNVIIDDIESSLTDENETEVKELKKSLAKKPKRVRNKKPANTPSTITLTEQIVELANEPTIKRGPVDEVEYVIAVSDSEGEEEPEVVKETPKPKNANVLKPIVVEEAIEEVVKPAVVEEAIEEVVKPAVVEEVKVAKKKTTKKVKNADIDVPAEIVEEVVIKEQLDLDVPKELPKELPKKVSKPRVKKVVEKKPVEVQGTTLVVEELTEENEV